MSAVASAEVVCLSNSSFLTEFIPVLQHLSLCGVVTAAWLLGPCVCLRIRCKSFITLFFFPSLTAWLLHDTPLLPWNIKSQIFAVNWKKWSEILICREFFFFLLVESDFHFDFPHLCQLPLRLSVACTETLHREGKTLLL